MPLVPDPPLSMVDEPLFYVSHSNSRTVSLVWTVILICDGVETFGFNLYIHKIVGEWREGGNNNGREAMTVAFRKAITMPVLEPTHT